MFGEERKMAFWEDEERAFGGRKMGIWKEEEDGHLGSQFHCEDPKASVLGNPIPLRLRSGLSVGRHGWWSGPQSLCLPFAV